RCGRKQATTALEDLGPLILRTIHLCVQADPERRGEERVPFPCAVQVCPVLPPSLELRDPVEGHGRDISLNGMNLILPSEPPGPLVYVQLQTESLPEPVAVLARVRRTFPVGEGQYEVAVQFPFDPIRNKPVELARAVVQADRFPHLATLDGDQPRLRPVSPVRTDHFTVYVANLRAYHKTVEIAANPKVELRYLAPSHDQVRITGLAETV